MTCGLRSVRVAHALLWTYVAIIALLLFAAPAHAAPGFSVGDVRCPEAGPCSVTITKSGKGSTYSKVAVSTLSGTALAGSDFGAVSTTLTFGNNQLSATIPIPIVNDTAVEGSETFQVRIAAVRYAAIVRGIATVTIVDDDAAPSPTPSPTTVTWTLCANQYGNCTIPGGGTAHVRYGAGTSWATLTVTGSVMCTNELFGDPLPGFDKSCYTDAVVGAPAPAPAPSPTPTPTPTPTPSPAPVPSTFASGGYAALKVTASGWPKPAGYSCPTETENYTTTYRASVPAGEVVRLVNSGFDCTGRRLWSARSLDGKSLDYFYEDDLTPTAAP